MSGCAGRAGLRAMDRVALLGAAVGLWAGCDRPAATPEPASEHPSGVVGSAGRVDDPAGLKDFVSGYDFDSARLADLPWQFGKALIGPGSVFDYDAYVKEHHNDWNYVQHRLGRERFSRHSFIPEDSPDRVYVVSDPDLLVVPFERIDPRSCRLTDGSVAGDFYLKAGTVFLEPNSYSTNVYLILDVLEYRDFDGDGYMDVLLRRTLAGSACPTETLIVSRRAPDGPFHIVDTVETHIRLNAEETYRMRHQDSLLELPLSEGAIEG